VHPFAAIEQRVRLTGGIERIGDVRYILATDWGQGVTPFPVFYDRGRAKGWKTSTVPCGHDAMLDLPAELTSALIAAA
jgi:hypothetical protein